MLSLAGLTGHAAEVRLVPRPIPGLDVPSVVSTGNGATPAAAAPSPMAAYNPPPENPNRARIVAIRRRADLPARLTADLAKPEASNAPTEGGRAQVAARPTGKVQIIPKEAVAGLVKALGQVTLAQP